MRKQKPLKAGRNEGIQKLVWKMALTKQYIQRRETLTVITI